MRKTFALFKKEVYSYLTLPSTYIFIMVFLILSGYFFWVILVNTREASMRETFGVIEWLLLIITPVLTMRLMAEERNSGTAELLFTCPISNWQIILGKYFAALFICCLIFLLTLTYPILISSLGDPDPWPILTGYLGLVFLGGCYIGIGLFASCMTQNPLLAAIITFATLVLFWAVDWVQSFIKSGFWLRIIEGISLAQHYANFSKGLLVFPDLVYFGSLTFLALFLAVRLLDIQRITG